MCSIPATLKDRVSIPRKSHAFCYASASPQETAYSQQVYYHCRHAARRVRPFEVECKVCRMLPASTARNMRGQASNHTHSGLQIRLGAGVRQSSSHSVSTIIQLRRLMIHGLPEEQGVERIRCSHAAAGVCSWRRRASQHLQFKSCAPPPVRELRWAKCANLTGSANVCSSRCQHIAVSLALQLQSSGAGKVVNISLTLKYLYVLRGALLLLSHTKS